MFNLKLGEKVQIFIANAIKPLMEETREEIGDKLSSLEEKTDHLNKRMNEQEKPEYTINAELNKLNKILTGLGAERIIELLKKIHSDESSLDFCEILLAVHANVSEEDFIKIATAFKGETKTILPNILETKSISLEAIQAINNIFTGELGVNKSLKRHERTRFVSGLLSAFGDANVVKKILEPFKGEKEYEEEFIDRIIKPISFEDLLKVNDRGMQTILKDVDSEDLLLSLKQVSKTLKEKIYKNMSKRAAMMLKEDLEYMGQVTLSEVKKAQREILKVAERLEDDGKIIIAEDGTFV